MTTHSYFILEIVGEGIQHVVEVPSSRLVRVVREEFEQASALLAWGFQETMQEHCRLGFYDVVCEERVAELTRHLPIITTVHFLRLQAVVNQIAQLIGMVLKSA